MQTEDGSKTAFSEYFSEHYHSTKDGAFNETLHKHVVPAFKYSHSDDEIVILDICFGLGYNTLMTLYYRDQSFKNKKVKIFSPEFDRELLDSLLSFDYPDILKKYKNVIVELVNNGYYKDDNTEIHLYCGDAREYIKTLKNESLDVVYQDAFSPSVNPLLWTKEYFADLVKLLKSSGVVTTYSIALKVRIAMFYNNLQIYLQENEFHRASTIASKEKIDLLKKVDMNHKILCNEGIEPLFDLNYI